MIRKHYSGSVAYCFGSRSADHYGSGSCFSLQWLSRCQLKISFFVQVFLCLLLAVGTLTSVFKNDKLLRNHKTVEIKFIFTFLLVDRRIRIRSNNYGSGAVEGSGAGITVRDIQEGIVQCFNCHYVSATVQSSCREGKKTAGFFWTSGKIKPEKRA